MEPVFLIALLSVVAVDLPPPAMLVSAPRCDKNVCTLEVPVAAKIRHPAVKATAAAARRSVGAKARFGKIAPRPIVALAKLKSIRRTAKSVPVAKKSVLVAKGVRLICPRRRCCCRQ